MKRTITLGLGLATLGAHVIHGPPCDDDGGRLEDGPGAAGHGDTGGEAVDDPALSMVPDTLAQGETAIVSLLADRPVDWTQVTDVRLYGDLTPCAMQARADELLLTLSVDPDAAVGGVDLVVETADGEAWWAEDVLFIVEAGGGSSSGDTGAAESGGSSGSGSSGGGSSGGGSSGGGSSGGGSSGSGSSGSGSSGSGSSGSGCG